MADATPLASAEATPLRRQPSQNRSRERVERMLAAATELIAAKGSDAMRMGEVAETAGVSIGSLYQYFPDKAAIIRTLAERYNVQEQACIKTELDKVRTVAGLRAALAGLIDTYYALFLAEPVMRDIWSGTQADRTLQDMDLAETRILGAMLAEALARLDPKADRAALDTPAFLTMHLVGSTVRLAIGMDRAEGDALVEALKQMMLRELLPV
ncbi:TetR/AcrR family transcriptional regulator [Phreatobacter stygius]|uniref:TetR/AcrR family transcriptional regulator n=1 Tax=Phreatobacter stygius TaxID=1940610 RepID=A0A4D7B188_9HYPH|nr:TetR/AcrR family transcriptional regulator [Phreatobacter stygius]QCI67384.1 TetR/AcrR family transcriptional regulator [Phreatobacter stygius]